MILKCRAPRLAIGIPRESEDLPTRAHVFWGWSEKIRQQNSTDDISYKDPSKVFLDVYLESKPTTDKGILSSILRIPSVTQNHSGMWDCTLRSQQANLSQAISVNVISKRTQYCEATEVRMNKGHYFWPQSLRKQLVQQRCIELMSGAEASTNVVSYYCNADGEWHNLNADSCSYVSTTTRMLQQMAKVNLTMTKTTALDIARRLHNFTHTPENLRRIQDPMDVEFIAISLLKFLPHVQRQPEIALLLLDIVSQLLLLPSPMFVEAQREHQSGHKLLQAVESAGAFVHDAKQQMSEATSGFHWIPSTNLENLFYPKNLFVEYLRLDSYGSITCVWLREGGRHFECYHNDSFPPLFDAKMDAAIQIPLETIMGKAVSHQIPLRLMAATFRNGHLMPHTGNPEKSTAEQIQLTSAIIGAKLLEVGQDVSLLPLDKELAESVSIVLRERPYHGKESVSVPAWFNASSQEWNSKVCQQIYTHQGLVMFSCNQLGYYGLLQRSIFLNDFASIEAGARFHHLPLAMYLGCAVLFLLCWLNIATFVCFGRIIRINRQQRHALVNSWLALAALCFTFCLGIHQTEKRSLCQFFGLLMHYLTLCVLLWQCVSLSSLYKRLAKSQRGVLASEMDGNTNTTGTTRDARLKKPILGIYLVGWGIAMLICGISSAVNIQEYSSYSFCFLHQPSALNALLVPVLILLLFMTILLICTFYHIKQRRSPMPQLYSDHTQVSSNHI